MKLATQGRWLWSRTIASTLVGQAVDTSLFILIAFGLGTALSGQPVDTALLWSLFISNYIFKVGVEVLCTPLTYAVVGFLKRAEREDYYDRNTNFNPFALAD
jgi:uncharacterized integral membrane protein (TIGR00697 family)